MSSYVQIRYGSNQTLICNTDCICINLLQYIRENCTSLRVEEELDLVDSFGSTQNLKKKLYDRSVQLLERGATYIPIVCSPREESTGSRSGLKSPEPSPNVYKENNHSIRLCLSEPVEKIFPHFQFHSEGGKSSPKPQIRETSSPVPPKVSPTARRGSSKGQAGNRRSSKVTTATVPMSQRASPKRHSVF
ncbi:uncharacterized protein LOC134855586 [Symsagittifera roscoffensis]|uniref:uncharacterized protein LOC134855586 n=1 Tax=Symsagittifera roscoffensis TaxID=84072 RepID=UPI00307B851C